MLSTHVAVVAEERELIAYQESSLLSAVRAILWRWYQIPLSIKYRGYLFIKPQILISDLELGATLGACFLQRE